MSMNDKQHYEFAEGLVAKAKEKGFNIEPQDLIDLMESSGEKEISTEDKAAILNLAAEIIYNEQQDTAESDEEEATAEDRPNADDSLEEAAAAGSI